MGCRRAIVRIVFSSTVALKRVETRVGGNHLLGQGHVASNEGDNRVRNHLFGDAAHFGDTPAEVAEILVERLHDVFGHGRAPLVCVGV
jgi:hypothetical protein